MRVISSALAICGLLLIAEAGITVAWQEPTSALRAHFAQRSLSAELAHAERLRTLGFGGMTARAQLASRARAMRSGVKPGDPIGRITIGRLHANFVMVQGTTSSSLRRGPGHYPGTSWPGLPGTVGIAGHRTTYLAPFRKLNVIKTGDPIVLQMPYGRFVYRAERRVIVSPSAYAYVMRSVGYDRLALTACHPLYSASQRIVVFARLVSMEAGRTARPAAARSDGAPAGGYPWGHVEPTSKVAPKAHGGLDRPPGQAATPSALREIMEALGQWKRALAPPTGVHIPAVDPSTSTMPSRWTWASRHRSDISRGPVSRHVVAHGITSIPWP